MVTYAMLVRRPAVTQFLTRRRNGGRVTGTFDVHTFESFPDWVGPDTGLERALGHLFTRLDPGSYHSACDSDSTVPLIPWWYEAFHDRFTNNWAVSVSIATQAHKWADAPPAWRLAAIRRAAVEAARIADEIFLEQDLTRVATRGIDIPARWLTQAQAHARMPGFVRHGASDPGRRSDPWPAGATEGDLFLAYYRAARTNGRYVTATTATVTPPATPNPSEEDDVLIFKSTARNSYFLAGASDRPGYILEPATLNALKDAGVKVVEVDPETLVNLGVPRSMADVVPPAKES